jgi:hypothetical protein
MSAAENLHERMWGQNINGILEEITDPEGVTWEYVPKRHIDTLELNKLGCPQINCSSSSARIQKCIGEVLTMTLQ